MMSEQDTVEQDFESEIITYSASSLDAAFGRNGYILSPTSTESAHSDLRLSPPPPGCDAAGNGSATSVPHFVNVTIRVRPLSVQEQKLNDRAVIEFPGHDQVSVHNSLNGKTKLFRYNKSFPPDASQGYVFKNCGIQHLINMAVKGYSCTVFAYGQTGSGKTYTITGPEDVFTTFDEESQEFYDDTHWGLIQRSFLYLFEHLERKPGIRYIINASYLEIYNEQVLDLLNPAQKRSLSIRWSKERGFYVENLFIVECETLDDLLAVLEEGLKNRQTRSTAYNEYSSRSHSMLTLSIDITLEDQDDKNMYVTKQGKICFVDLAGSEKVRESKGQGTLTEANNINRSLLVLGNCISCLGDSKRRSGHIPYRDSKLTMLLADSLGGNGVTLMIACIAPSLSNVAETISTLRYANRAKKIKSKPVVKMDPKEKMILSIKRELNLLRNENKYLRQHLDFPTTEQVEKRREKRQALEAEKQLLPSADPNMNYLPNTIEAGLYEMLQEYMVENESLRIENIDLNHSKLRLTIEHEALNRENERLVRKLESISRVFFASPLTTSTPSSSWDSQSGFEVVSPMEPTDATSLTQSTHFKPSKPEKPPITCRRQKKIEMTEKTAYKQQYRGKQPSRLPLPVRTLGRPLVMPSAADSDGRGKHNKFEPDPGKMGTAGRKLDRDSARQRDILAKDLEMRNGVILQGTERKLN